MLIHVTNGKAGAILISIEWLLNSCKLVSRHLLFRQYAQFVLIKLVNPEDFLEVKQEILRVTLGIQEVNFNCQIKQEKKHKKRSIKMK